VDSVTNVIFGTMTLGYEGYGSRVKDPGVAQAMVDAFAAAGYHDLDTAHAYGGGSCERMLGDLKAPERFAIATRFDPIATPSGHEPDVLKQSVGETVARLGVAHVDLLYLAFRDPKTELERTLQAVQELFQDGVFTEFGLSNFSVEDLDAVRDIMASNGWVTPSVYQGLYNALSRTAESDLLPALHSFGMRFHAYNPLAGGAFAPGFGADHVEAGSRFDPGSPQGQFYRSRYWTDSYVSALQAVRAACADAGISPIAAALQWLVHHSDLRGEYRDGIILGASSLAHLEENLLAVAAGPLPREVLDAIEAAAEVTRPTWPEISRLA
jgi:aflatoxin B1 aldehyde reductase